MPRKPAPKPDDPEQSERFIAMAREIGAAETEAEADAALRKVVKPRAIGGSAPSSSRRSSAKDRS